LNICRKFPNNSRIVCRLCSGVPWNVWKVLPRFWSICASGCSFKFLPFSIFEFKLIFNFKSFNFLRAFCAIFRILLRKIIFGLQEALFRGQLF
jgi:hypothetical protein